MSINFFSIEIPGHTYDFQVANLCWKILTHSTREDSKNVYLGSFCWFYRWKTTSYYETSCRLLLICPFWKSGTATTTDSTSPFMGPNPLFKETVYKPTLGSKQHVSEDENGWMLIAYGHIFPNIAWTPRYTWFQSIWIWKTFVKMASSSPSFGVKSKKHANNKNSRNHHQHPGKFRCLSPKIMEVNGSNDVPYPQMAYFFGDPNQLGWLNVSPPLRLGTYTHLLSSQKCQVAGQPLCTFKNSQPTGRDRTRCVWNGGVGNQGGSKSRP